MSRFHILSDAQWELIAPSHRRRRGSANGQPVGLDANAYKGRNVIERQYAHLKQWRGLATRYAKYSTVYRAAVVLNAVIAWSKRLSDTP